MPTEPPAPTPNWDDRYGSTEYMFGTEPNDFLREVAHQLPKGRVLCLADGEGRNGVFLAEQGLEVTSIDGSVVASRKAAQLAAERKVDMATLVADLTTHDLGVDAWQGIVSIFFHLPSAVRQELHGRVVAALAPGGLVVLEAYTPRQPAYGTGGPGVADLLMTAQALQAEFRDLEILLAVEKERPVVEGKLHTGLAHVVQLIARKATRR